jgi:hypothetical protein
LSYLTRAEERVRVIGAFKDFTGGGRHPESRKITCDTR